MTTSPFDTDLTDISIIDATYGQLDYIRGLLSSRIWNSTTAVAHTYISRAAVLNTVIGWAVDADSRPDNVAERLAGVAEAGEAVNTLLAAMRGDAAAELRYCYVPLTREGASKMIDWLKTLPLRPDATAAGSDTTVPAGRYALPIENSTVGNDLAFYSVDRPTEGRWAGRVFVNQVLGGDQRQPVRGKAAETILVRIAADIEGAAARYGHALGRCGFCHRPLTNKASRERGVGPDCAARYL